MAGLVPAIHVLRSGKKKTWMPGASLGMAARTVLHCSKMAA
jgi:hypothetical protein